MRRICIADAVLWFSPRRVATVFDEHGDKDDNKDDDDVDGNHKDGDADAVLPYGSPLQAWQVSKPNEDSSALHQTWSEIYHCF